MSGDATGHDYPVQIDGKLLYRCMRYEDAVFCVERWKAVYPNAVCEIFHVPFELVHPLPLDEDS